MIDRQIKVLIVDDSAVSRELLKFIIESDPRLKVIGVANNGDEALTKLEKLAPDVITMDIVMPKMDGFEVTKRILQRWPIPIVVISSCYAPWKVEQSFKAMEAGALAILEKPGGIRGGDYERLANEIIYTLKAMSEVKLVARRHDKPLSSYGIGKTMVEAQQRPITKMGIQAVAIGASLGGPIALQNILSELPANFPVPIFIVQHISNGFVEGLVEWLGRDSKLKIKVPVHDEIALPGHVYIAPSKCHMEIVSGRISLVSGEKDYLMPSVGRLFRSVAKEYGPRAIGVILTGMGVDGAKELLLMRQKGAHTIAQSAESCAIFGMPKEAISLGAAEHVAALENIAKVLLDIIVKEQ